MRDRQSCSRLSNSSRPRSISRRFGGRAQRTGVGGDCAGGLSDWIGALDRVKALGKEKPGDLFLRAITLDKLQQRKPALEAYEQFLAVSGGRFPDQEFQARQRAHILKLSLGQK